MLIVVAFVALWLSTIVDYPGSDDVRHAIVLLTVIASGLAAYCNIGWRKCFWLVFCSHYRGIYSGNDRPRNVLA